MKISVLIDNVGCGTLKSEWGLSFHISFEGRNYLLDTGGSDAYMDNAKSLGINLSDVDDAVISHAHYDHSLGMEAFYKINDKAPFHLSANARENCYAGWYFISKYIGLPKGILSEYAERIVYHRDLCGIGDGVYLVPHSTPGLNRLGKQNHLFVKNGLRYQPDDFSHEQSLVFKTEKGLIVLNSCSNSGPEVVVSEVLKAFPGESVQAYLGGLHLFRFDDAKVKEVSDRLAACDIGKIYTGHCTGTHAFDLLKERLGDRIEQLHSGLVIQI